MATKYTIRYQYGTYSGIRTVYMADNEEGTAIDKMWAHMRHRRELTLGMAHQSAKVLNTEYVPDEDEE